MVHCINDMDNVWNDMNIVLISYNKKPPAN